MEDDKKGGWSRLTNVSFDRKATLRRLKKAELSSTRHARRFLFERLENIKLVRREVAMWAALMGLMIAGMGLQFGLSQRGYMELAPKSGGTYSEASLGPINTLNPLYATTSSEVSFSRLVFSSLYNYDAKGYLRRDIASKITAEQDGKIYKVSLRKDAVWHDGEKLTAKDVVFTVNLIKNPATRSPLRINWVDVSVRAVDDYTVEFTLPAAYAAFPYSLTFPILPLHVLVDINAGALRESTFSSSPIGSGPFKFNLLQRSDAIINHEVVHLVANKDYYGGRPRLDQFEIYSYKTQDDIRTAVKGREVNGAVDIANVATSELGSTYQVISAPVASGVYAIFNNKNTILADAAVRKALQLGTDVAKVREAAGGKVKELDLPYISSQVPGSEKLTAPTTDTTQAKSMLEGAGWKLNDLVRYKDGKPLSLSITTTKDSQYISSAEELARQWKALGLQVTINSMDSSSVSSGFVQNVLQARNFDVLVYELAIGADPDVYAYWHSSQTTASGYNFANYTNRNADAALASARSRSEVSLRNAKYIAFAEQWLSDAPSIALYQPVLEYVTNKSNVSLNAQSNLILPTDRYAQVGDWSVESGMVYKTP